MQSIKSLVIALFAVASMLTFARPDAFDRPVHTLSVGGLTSDQSLRKTAIEAKVSAAMKRIANESGSLAFTLAISGTSGNEFMNMSGGWADYDAGDKFALGKLPNLPLEPNVPVAAASFEKFVTVAAMRKCVDIGKCSYTENALKASGLAVWNNIVQPWHTQCLVSDLAKISATTCDIPYGYNTSYSEISKITGWKFPISFKQQISFEFSTNIPRERTQNISNLGFNLITLIIENKTGRDYYDWVRENVTRPAGVSDVEYNIASGKLELHQPGEMSYDSRDEFTDKPQTQKSQYDGVTEVRVSEAGLIENRRGDAGVTATMRTWLKLVNTYSFIGAYAPANINDKASSTVLSAEFFGMSGFMYRNAVRGYSFVLAFNRYAHTADGNLNTFTAWIKLREILDAEDISRYDWDLTKVSPGADQRVCRYELTDNGVSRFFPADPVGQTALDQLIAEGRVTGRNTGDCWNMWQPGAVGTTSLYRYFYPQSSTHFFGPYTDAKFIQNAFPNSFDYSATFHFETIALASKLPDASGNCSTGVPLYRGFRATVGKQNHIYTVNKSTAQNTADYVYEGAVFCVDL